MSVKRFGIYLAYAPTVDLRHEGLGRYLVAFLKGAAQRDDVRFVVLCPSWSQQALQAFFASEGLADGQYDICYPRQQPLILRGYTAYLNYKARPRRMPLRQRLLNKLRSVKDAAMQRLEKQLAQAYSFSSLLPVLAAFAILLIVALLFAPLLLIAALCFWLGGLSRRAWARAIRPLLDISAKVRVLLANPKDDGFVLRLYRRMAEAEAQRMLLLIEDLPPVSAWYCPTAFWPAFNAIQGPKLMCVPDLVLAEFPADYAGVGGDRYLLTFETLDAAIRAGENFVTYSETIKREILINRYAVHPSAIAVIPHAANDLSRWVDVTGFDDVATTTRNYCEWLFSCALQKSSNAAYVSTFTNNSVNFLFYASQFRPNKNVLSLLKAYQYLLREKLIGHKLILTGNPGLWPPVQKFINEHQLENDVLCLSQLTVQELAACYKLAELAVNPSLSEGGCPFTFTEALSVGTPVVMARIAVSEEVLVDPQLQAMSFFDPYDWKDIAQRIEWALNNRQQLLAVQHKTFSELMKRSWTDVVNEHIGVLNRIADATQRL